MEDLAASRIKFVNDGMDSCVLEGSGKEETSAVRNENNDQSGLWINQRGGFLVWRDLCLSEERIMGK